MGLVRIFNRSLTKARQTGLMFDDETSLDVGAAGSPCGPRWRDATPRRVVIEEFRA